MRKRLKHVLLLNSAGGFSPSDISGLRLWLDASDPASLFQDAAGSTPAGNGDPVGQWADKSGNGNNLTQGAASLQPTVAANGISLDGTEIMDASISHLSGDVDFSVIVVATRDASAAVDAGGLWGQPASTNGLLDRVVSFQHGSGSGTNLTLLPGPANGERHVISLTKSTGSTSTSNLHMYKNGVQGVLSLSGGEVINWGGTFWLGGWLNSGFYWHGVVHECLVYDSKLAGQDLANLHSYLIAKWVV